MAKTVGDLLIKLGVDGIEGVEALKGSLRQLSQATRLSGKDIDKLTTGIKNYSRVVGSSEKTLRGQITALKGLREQAQLGGASYIKLTRDIERYEKRLQSLGKTAGGTAEKLSTVNQVLGGQIPARKPAAFGRQISALNKGLSELSVTSDAYLRLLRQIQEREQAFTQAQARQAVIGRAQTAAEGPVDKRTFFQIDKELPNTTRALNLRLSELQETLVDTNLSSEKYRNTQREIIEIEKRLADATNRRVEAIKGVTDQQRRAEQLAERSRGRKQRLLANQSAADAEYNAALGAHIASPAMPTRELSNLYKSIGQIQTTGIAAEIEMMGNSYKKVANDIKRTSLASRDSISSLQGQRVAFMSLRDVLDPTSQDFRQVTKEVERLDKRLEKLNRKPRINRQSLLQGAGTIASAGIFGGPEGALGAAGGFALGGVPGAVVGAGVGAVASQLRQQLAELAEYTTKLNLAKQTLALAANGQDEYNKLLQIARNISQDYAVSLKGTIEGFSQVAVAARANNLTLGETETIYRGLVSAGVAFGKSQQDIDAIVRATVQVLSKGKLSAEELQGQIGERLPGAVAKFAEATGRSLPQLAKDLKAGTVQISDFVDFSEKQLLDYDKVAKLIGDAPEKAGARLKLALDEAVENYGGFFLTVGAGFQDLFKGIVDFANDNASVMQNMIVDFIIAGEKIQEVFADVAENIQKTLGPVLGGIVNLFSQGVDTIYAGIRRDQELAAGGFDPVAARQRAEEQARNVTPGGSLNLFEFQKNAGEAFAVELKSAMLEGRKILREQGNDRVDDSPERRQQLLDQFKFKPFKFGEFNTGKKLPGGSDGGTGDSQAAKDLARRVAQAQQLEASMTRRLAVARQENELGKFLVQQENQRAELQDKIAKLKQGGTTKEIDEATAAAERLHAQEQAALLQERVKKISENALKPLQDAVKAVKDKVSVEERTKELLAKGIGPERAKAIIAIEKEKKKTIEILDIYIAVLEAKVAQKDATEAEIEALERLRKAKKEAENIDGEEATEGGNYDKEKSDFENFKETFEKGLKEMVDIGPKIANVALGAIGSVTDGLIEMAVTGKANFKEMAASILKDLAKIILKAAMARIVASVFGVNLAAKGMIVQGGVKKPYARGGIVSAPTVFPMAGGDVGLMGEAGPEAIMPLKRGNNGKLGVEVAGRNSALEAMSRYSVRNTIGGGPASNSSNDEKVSGDQSGQHPIDVRYSVERINSVDYVTADQFENGIRQAADQGAKKGEQQTLRRLQMSGGTRKRLGM